MKYVIMTIALIIYSIFCLYATIEFSECIAKSDIAKAIIWTILCPVGIILYVIPMLVMGGIYIIITAIENIIKKTQS